MTQISSCVKDSWALSAHKHFPHIIIMIQRCILRRSRAFRVTSRPTSTSFVTRPRNSSFRKFSPQERIAVRSYTSTNTIKDGANSDAPAEETSQSELIDDDSVKKDLESKDKEIIALKVRPQPREH